MDVFLAGAVFLVAYALIASERLDRTLVALLGGLLVVALGVIDQEEAFAAIDFNVIFLLAGMMVLAGALAKTGFFECLAGQRGPPVAGRAVAPARHPVRRHGGAVGAARQRHDGRAADAGHAVDRADAAGLAVAVPDQPDLRLEHRRHGDPHRRPAEHPHRLGGRSRLRRLPRATWRPVVVVIMVAFRRDHVAGLRPDTWRTTPTGSTSSPTVDPASAIKDRPLLIRALVVLGLTIVGFLAHSALGLEAATIALLGATVLMLVGPLDPHETLRDIEWSTLFFFVGLFILVEAIVHVGIVGGIADALADADRRATGRGDDGDPVVLGAGARPSSTTSPTRPPPSRSSSGWSIAASTPTSLWWSLALGACLGGNLTIVGASANIVVANLAARDGHPSPSCSSSGTGWASSSPRW